MTSQGVSSQPSFGFPNIRSHLRVESSGFLGAIRKVISVALAFFQDVLHNAIVLVKSPSPPPALEKAPPSPRVEDLPLQPAPKEFPQIFCPEQGTVFIGTGRDEDEKSEVKPTQAKTSFSSCLGITPPQMETQLPDGFLEMQKQVRPLLLTRFSIPQETSQEELPSTSEPSIATTETASVQLPRTYTGQAAKEAWVNFLRPFTEDDLCLDAAKIPDTFFEQLTLFPDGRFEMTVPGSEEERTRIKKVNSLTRALITRGTKVTGKLKSDRELIFEHGTRVQPQMWGFGWRTLFKTDTQTLTREGKDFIGTIALPDLMRNFGTGSEKFDRKETLLSLFGMQ